MSDPEATVTVVIPCYNYAHFLPQATRSALDQTGVQIDVIIVDDASSDHSLQVAQDIAKRDSRVRVLSNALNIGPVHTFNRGLSEASGEFLVRLDADDLLTPESIARAVAVARAFPSVGLIYGHPLHFSGSDLPQPRLKATKWTVWPGRQWLGKRCRQGLNVITSPEVVMRMSTVRVVGGQQPLAHTHDMEMWLRIAAFADVAYIHGADQAWHREHRGSLSARKVDVVEDLDQRRQAFETLFKGPAGAIPEAGDLAVHARQALLRSALSSAQHELDLRMPEPEKFDNLVRAARSLDPNVSSSPAWRRLEKRAGRRETQLRLRILPILRRARARTVSSWRWRQWHRNGVFGLA